MSCGSSCVRYILKELSIDSVDLDIDMIWIFELALFLNETLDNEIQLYCYKSKLLNDYKKSKNSSFIGFVNLKKYFESGKKINKKKLNVKNLKKEIDSSKYIIMCVESKLLNDDDSMSGGHYIIITECDGDIVKIVNPQKDKYQLKKMSLKDTVRLSNKFGSWRILIK